MGEVGVATGALVGGLLCVLVGALVGGKLGGWTGAFVGYLVGFLAGAVVGCRLGGFVPKTSLTDEAKNMKVSVVTETFIGQDFGVGAGGNL